MVGITIISRIQDISRSDSDTVSSKSMHIPNATEGDIKSIDVEDGILFLHMETGEGTVIMGYDLSTGQRVSELVISQNP